MHSQYHVLIYVTPWRRHLFHFSCFFGNAWLQNEKIKCASKFDLKFPLQRVKIWIEIFETCRKSKKQFAFKTSLYEHCYPVQALLCAVTCVFETHLYDLKFLRCVWLRFQNLTSSQNLSSKILQCIRLWTKTFLHPVPVWLEIFEKCRNSKKSVHSKHHLINTVTPCNQCFVQSPFFFETHDYNMKILRCVITISKFYKESDSFLKNFTMHQFLN